MKKNFILLLIALAALPVFAETQDIPMLFYGEASWYGEQFHGKQTASGEIYDMNLLSAAHKSLPFGTRIRVTNLENNKEVIVRVNDRGPSVTDRVLDLSLAAAKLLDFAEKGTAKIEARVIEIDGDGTAQVSDNFTVDNQRSAVQDTAETAESVSRSGSPVRVIRPEEVYTPEKEPDKPNFPLSADGRYVIQAGAFLSLDNAEGLLRRYQAMGLPVYLRQLSRDHLHRVWIGPFAARADAEAQLKGVRRISEQAYICNKE
ncbi:MAG: septal ring lytic transglycosylase RlpA family protein [Spirochaetota bacterium]|jgi:rare lipoprotein A|nr:septal ring lytic transglycosylase RlpA family protein [Spirochaetota bacterium]